MRTYENTIPFSDEPDEMEQQECYDVPLPSLTYKQILSKLESKVIGQHDAKKALAFAGHMFLKYTEDSMAIIPRILLAGPTGVGKTLLAKTLSSILEIPCLFIDATQLTCYGYRGETLASRFIKFYENIQSCSLSDEQAYATFQRSIIVIDEFDKLCGFNMNEDHGAWRRGLQTELLTLFQADKISYCTEGERGSTLVFDPRGMLMIMCGAFSGFDQLDVPREKTAGFLNKPQLESSGELIHERLIRYGIMRELAGRIGDIVFVTKLCPKDIMTILTNKKLSPFESYKKMLKDEGKELLIDQNVMRAIASHVPLYETGARALQYLVFQLVKKAYAASSEQKVVHINHHVLNAVLCNG